MSKIQNYRKDKMMYGNERVQNEQPLHILVYTGFTSMQK